MYHVGDYIIQIKNGYQSRKKQLVTPYSNINKAIGAVLVKEGFLAKVEESDINGKKTLTTYLRYENRKSALQGVKIISKPSVRVYIDLEGMSKDKDRASTVIISTSNGILTGDQAKKKGVGGELLFRIW
jgi:small subunit ribosomal protein S8